MLTDLSFLNPGQNWPPKKERDRLDLYAKNLDLFENKQSDVYREAFKRIARVINNFDEVVSYEVIANYQKLISLKISDLLLGEDFKAISGKNESAEQLSVDSIKEYSDLQNTSYMACIDVSRYGDGLLMVSKYNGKGIIEVTQPSIWFPVVDPDNIKRTIFHVLAWVVEKSEGNFVLRVNIHERGRYEQREYALDKTPQGFTINSLLSGGRFFPTGLDDFAIIQIPNVITSDRVHGMDDYTDIDSIVSELMVRISQISRILDKHASPSVSGPTTALERDPVTGDWRLKMGNYFPRDGKDDAEVKYITWDGQLEASFKQVELLINLLHAISEVGSSLLGDKGDEAGSAPSGTSLRFRMVSPLAKARRIANRFKPQLIKAIKLCSQLGGDGIVNLSKAPVSITFQDGLPNDPKEEAEIISTRSGGGKTLSTKTILTRYDGLSEADAETELEEIQAEEEAANPVVSMSTPFNGNNDPAANGGGA